MELHLAPTRLEEIGQYVENAFNGDINLLNTFHTSPGTLQHCVDNTMEFIHENAAYYKDDIEFYAVILDGVAIGYTVIIRNEQIPNELYSFGINIKHRRKDILLAWLKTIREKIGVPYYIVLWSKNTRAINFFERNGFAVERENKYLNDETKTLIVCRQGA